MIRFFLIFALSATIYFAATTSQAQNGLPDNDNSDQPLEISAEQTLEWHRNNNQYIARGDVVATQGNVTIKAEILTADYRETETAAFEIYRLTAADNVEIISEGNIARSDRAVYDVDKGLAVLTGDNLVMESPEQTVTARESFEYWVTEGRLTAIGNARVTRGQDTLEADKISAVFREDQSGQRRLKSLTATDNVVIKTPNEVLTGARGVYRADTNIATVRENVTIKRGPNILQGDKAEINMTTNVSRMISGGQNGQRVRGVFYPGSDGPAP